MTDVVVSYIVPVIHVFACLFLIVVVLLQTGKGADMGAVFGGGSQTLFGSGGAGNLLTKLTTGTAVAFMVTSLILWYAQSHRGTSGGGLLNRIPTDAAAPAAPSAPAPPPPAPAAANKPEGNPVGTVKKSIEIPVAPAPAAPAPAPPADAPTGEQ